MKRRYPLSRQGMCGFWLAVFSAMSGTASAAYPDKPIRVIVPAAPGGGADFVARLLGQHLSPGLGQPIVIDNRAGAAGNIAAELTARAPADGYTLLVVNSSHASNVNLYRNLSYDPIKDFAPISHLVSNFFLLTVHPSSPVKTVKEFVTLAKSKKGELTYASAGSGQGAHLGMELFKTLAGFDAVHVPYNGIGPATTSLLGGQVDVALLTPPSTVPLVTAGKLKVLAVTGPETFGSAVWRSDRRGIRIPGLRSEQLAGVACACAHAERRHYEDLSGDCEKPEASRSCRAFVSGWDRTRSARRLRSSRLSSRPR